ncbi:hypothetical protein FOCG_18113 [Fusarium oxysporum f. sp. radicis-lycopersici 26381]|nr:hypothetical protein FOCG_18113 [Fusarium oxysporum f. sp. radicis-lycopersici 26381]
MDCHYPVSSKSSASARSEESLPTPSESSQVERPSNALGPPPEDFVSSAAPTQEILENNIIFDFGTSSFSSLTGSNELLVTNDFDSLETWQLPSDFIGHADLGPLSQHIPVWAVDDGPDNMWKSSGDTNSTSPSAGNSDFCYTCLTQAMKTHEAVETAAWAQRKIDNDTSDILQKQKKVTAECMELLDCEKCNAQPAYVMMLLSICEKLLETLEVVCRSISPDENRPCQRHQDERCPGQRVCLGLEGNTYRRQSHSKGNTKRTRRHLDEEDELVILQSLVKARGVKLKGLLNRLHIMISKHNWPAHEGRIQQLEYHFVKELEP